MTSPSVLRSNVDRVSKKNRALSDQNERLVRMLLMARIRDFDLDFADGMLVVDEYRPVFELGYDEAFTADAVNTWLARRAAR